MLSKDKGKGSWCFRDVFVAFFGGFLNKVSMTVTVTVTVTMISFKKDPKVCGLSRASTSRLTSGGTPLLDLISSGVLE